MTKHGVIVTLAGECGLDVHQKLGFYRLNEDIVTGVDRILCPYGLLFVPTAHCFLECKWIHVDLTEGNCNGKNKVIDEYDFVVDVPVDESAEEGTRRYFDYLDRYLAIEPRLAALTREQVLKLIGTCHAQMERRRIEMLTSTLPAGRQLISSAAHSPEP